MVITNLELVGKAVSIVGTIGGALNYFSGQFVLGLIFVGCCAVLLSGIKKQIRTSSI